MELNRKGQSLKLVFLKYLISAGAGLILSVVLAMLCFAAFYNSNMVLPANYTENIILENRKKISESEKLDLSLIPENTSYLFISKDGKIIQTDMTSKVKKNAVDFHNGNRVSTSASSFMEIKRSDGYLIVNYSVQPRYTNQWMESHFPKLNVLSVVIIILFCFITSLLITLLWAGKLAKQLTPMLEASEEISKQNLDFKIGKSNIREFNDVLNSMDKMKSELGESLQKNWINEENRRNQISALTHDLKTPISVVRGNSELLKDTNLTDEQEIYVDFIIKNTERIQDYTNALMVMNKSDSVDELNIKKIKVETVAEKFSMLAKEITSVGDFILDETVDVKEDAYIEADINLLERAFQNIVSNAAEYSPKHSIIELVIETADNCFSVKVLDEGRGFSDEDLVHADEQFYRGDKSRHSSINYGLGLYSVKQIMKLHNGELLFKNRNLGKGAEVTIHLPLTRLGQ